MTRAEEALFVTGALAAREEEPGPNSWYTRLAGLFDPADALEDPLWGSRLETGPRAVPPPAPRANLLLRQCGPGDTCTLREQYRGFARQPWSKQHG
jgi:hypothetical protein